jgi:hypothetical protein
MRERYVAYIKRVVDSAPPLSAEQKAKLRVLFSLPATSGSRPGGRCTITIPRDFKAKVRGAELCY